MKRWIKGGLLFVLLYALFLLIRLPAASAYQFVKKDMNPIQLYQLGGSVWNGKAAQLRINQYQFSQLSWDIEVLKMLTGRIGARISIQDEQYPLHGHISLSLGSTLTLSGVQGKIPAAIIPSIAHKPDFNLKGDLEVSLKSLSVEQNLVRQAEGKLVLRNASINLPGTVSIGDLQADIATRDQDIVVQLKDREAPIGLEGIITLKKDQSYTGRLVFSPTSRSDAGVINLLRNSGTSLQNGSIELRFKGQM